jgi:hypothetical protein
MKESKAEIQCDKMRCNAESGATNGLDVNGRTLRGREVAVAVMEVPPGTLQSHSDSGITNGGDCRPWL